jgi:hypothetical protein
LSPYTANTCRRRARPDMVQTRRSLLNRGPPCTRKNTHGNARDPTWSIHACLIKLALNSRMHQKKFWLPLVNSVSFSCLHPYGIPDTTHQLAPLMWDYIRL